MNDNTSFTRPAPMMVQNFKPVSVGALISFVDVILPSGMVLHRCSVFRKDGRTWASPPSKQVIGHDGMLQRTADGKARYEPTVSFVDRATQDRVECWRDRSIADRAAGRTRMNVLHPDIERLALLGWRIYPASNFSRAACIKEPGASATRDVAKLEAWSREFPGCNWRIVFEGSGVWGLDVDAPSDDHAADGVAALASLVKQHGPLPPRPR